MTANTNWKKFSAETTQALFVAVEEDDLVEANISLPQQIDLECSPESIRDNYALCLQFWEDGFSRRELLQLVNGFLQDPQLAAATRMRYKYIRARYKHLRFAQQLYGAPHRANRLFHTTTVVLGQSCQEPRETSRQVADLIAGDAGYWQGEVYCQRRSGERFPAWQSLSVVRGKSGAVSNFVIAFSDVSEIHLAAEKLDRLFKIRLRFSRLSHRIEDLAARPLALGRSVYRFADDAARQAPRGARVASARLRRAPQGWARRWW